MSVNAKTGALALTISVVDPGTFRWLTTFPNGKFGAFSSAGKCKGWLHQAGRKVSSGKIVFPRAVGRSVGLAR